MVFLTAMEIQQDHSFLKALTPSFTPVLERGFAIDDHMPIDLSVSNKELLYVDIASAKAIGAYIQQKLGDNNFKVAYGGYLEHRGLYDRSAHFKMLNKALKRNIHLGLDLWCQEGTSVLAPLQGKVHSFKDNQNYGDYGPCIILEHQQAQHTFYSLYGHLDRQSLMGLQPGMIIDQGQSFARLGGTSINGDYAPHLHIQLILDMAQYQGDYPGVSSMNDLHYYKSNCPDPNLLLKIMS